jgi:hypothetical protein
MCLKLTSTRVLSSRRPGAGLHLAGLVVSPLAGRPLGEAWVSFTQGVTEGGCHARS